MAEEKTSGLRKIINNLKLDNPRVMGMIFGFAGGVEEELGIRNAGLINITFGVGYAAGRYFPKNVAVDITSILKTDDTNITLAKKSCC